MSLSWFYTDCFVYFQTHSVYIVGGRHNIGYWTCCQISVWQRHWITNNGLGEQWCPRIPGSTKTKQRKQHESSAAILSRTKCIRLVLYRETKQQQLFSQSGFTLTFSLFIHFTCSPYWLLSSLKEERNGVVCCGREKIPWCQGQWET